MKIESSLTALGSVSALVALGCSVTTGAESPGSEASHRFTVVAITRSSIAGSGLDQRAQATVGVASLSQATGAERAGTLVGVMLARLPEAQQCGRVSRDEPNAGRVEFVDVGQVVVQAGGRVTSLAPRALPTVGGVSGVLYTSRDQDALSMPEGAAYSVMATGGAFPGFQVNGTAPRMLTAVNVNGQPIEELTRVPLGAPLDVSWQEGSAEDLVYIEVSGANGTFGCSFRDDLGAGSLPASALARGPARLSLHRVRRFPLPFEGGEVSFDFATLHQLEVHE